VPLDYSIFAELVELTRRKRALDTELLSVNGAIKEMNKRVLREFEKGDDGGGLDRIRVAGGTVYLSHEIRAKREEGVDPEVINESLRAAGLEGYLQESFNLNTLSAHFRELVKEEGGDVTKVRVPAGIVLTEEFVPRVRLGD
jgi:hypothetical protein